MAEDAVRQRHAARPESPGRVAGTVIHPAEAVRPEWSGHNLDVGLAGSPGRKAFAHREHETAAFAQSDSANLAVEREHNDVPLRHRVEPVHFPTFDVHPVQAGLTGVPHRSFTEDGCAREHPLRRPDVYHVPPSSLRALQSQVLRLSSSEEWFSGTVVAVTGGARGIGAATVSAFGTAGARVASLDVDPEESGASGSALFTRCDVSSPADVAKAFSTVEAELGPVDVLVNNAGVNAGFDPVSMSPDEWDTFFAVDLRSMWLCARAVLPRMRERGGGSIVNVASIQATLTQAGAFPYAAAKAGVLGLTTSLALEEGPFGIRVNAVRPATPEPASWSMPCRRWGTATRPSARSRPSIRSAGLQSPRKSQA